MASSEEPGYSVVADAEGRVTAAGLTEAIGRIKELQEQFWHELALTGDMFSAEDAMRMGLVNRVVPEAEVRAATEELAQKIASKSALGIRSGKEAFYRQVEMPLEDAFAYANEAMLEGLLCGDAEEGTRAFFEKRAPSWADA